MEKIVFIDSRAENYQSLATDIESETELVILDSTQDGVAQITQGLMDRTGIEEVHIIYNGGEKSFQLGSTQLNADNLEAYTSQLQQWAAALTDNATIFLYDCNAVSEQVREAFVQKFSQLTGVDVGEPSDMTDGVQLESDWYLEQQLELELHSWINLRSRPKIKSIV